MEAADESVPERRLFGPQTDLAVTNFRFGNPAFGHNREFVRSLAQIKAAAAKTNAELQLIDWDVAAAIIAAAEEMAQGGLDRQLVVDELEGSGGTSINMNVNEVLAARAAQLLGKPIGALHSNDVVNRCQSTNDVVPSAIKMATRAHLPQASQALRQLANGFRGLAAEHMDALKLGRTCLQDAQPMSFGQTFEAWAAVCSRHADCLRALEDALLELPIGATAIGTGLGAQAGYRAKVIDNLAEATGVRWRASPNLFDSLSNSDVFARVSGEVRNAGASLAKIGNDLQILASGPAGGLGEIRLPLRQAGSSIMPGKVNPVMPMAMCQLGFVLSGYDAIVSQACQHGQLEINPYEPVIAAFLLKGLRLLDSSASAFLRFCVADLTIDREQALRNLLRSSAIATAFVADHGYDKVADLVRLSLARDESFAETADREGLLKARDLMTLLAQSAAGPDAPRA